MLDPKSSPGPPDHRPDELPPKQLALPVSDKPHTFAELSDLALISALFGLSVCVLCMTGDTLPAWHAWRERYPLPADQVRVFDVDKHTLADWDLFFDHHPFELVILPGATAELQAQRLSTAYLAELVERLPAEMVVLA